MKRKSKPNRGSFVISIAALESRVLFNTVINVNTFKDQIDPPASATVSLRDALAKSQTTGVTTINLPTGSYKLTLGELKVASTTGLVTVSSVSGSATIDGQSQSRVLENQAGSTLALADVIVTGGYLDDGSYGAGIENTGSLTLTNSQVRLNTMASQAGGGGGISNSGTLAVNNSAITNNTIAEVNGSTEGGGVYNSGTFKLNGSTVSGNNADYGAGITNYGTLISGGSTVSGNTAFYDGGGIANVANATLTNTTVALNHSEYTGGGILNLDTLTLTNCTVTGNSAESGDDATNAYGGGIDNEGGSVTIGNSIVADNSVTAFSPAKAFGPDVSGPFASQGNNLIGQTDGSSGWIGSDLVGSSAVPLDPKLQSLDNYGGATATELPLAGSPAINHGSNLLALGITQDQRGFARVVNGLVDIGADEVQLAISPGGQQNVFFNTATPIALGSFSDAGGTGSYKVDISWGDGSADSKFTVNSPGSLGSVSHTYKVVSTVTGSVTITDGNGNIITAIDPTVVVSDGGSLLSGTVVGTAGSYHNLGNTVAKAFDGNINTYVDGANPNGNVAGLDLGSARVITKIAYVSRVGFGSRMNGGFFQGSNDPNFGSATTLYTIAANANPSSSSFTTQVINVPGSFRYVRYVSPAGSYGNVAEIQFFGVKPGSLGGTVIGTAGSYENQGNTFGKAFDNDLNTFFDGPTANGDTVGLDLGTAKTITQISFAPRSGFASRMVGGTFQASNSADFSNAVTLYTITAAPVAGSLTTVTINVTTAYRYVRYVGTNGSFGNVAELAFFS